VLRSVFEENSKNKFPKNCNRQLGNLRKICNMRKKIRALWNIAPCSLVGVDRRFRRACCLHHQGEEGF
jgi:hypothetical protein